MTNFRTALSIEQAADGNNSTRVLKPPVLGCQYLRRCMALRPAAQWMSWFYEHHAMAESNWTITSALRAGGWYSIHCEMARQFGSHQCDRQPQNDSRNRCFHVRRTFQK